MSESDGADPFYKEPSIQRWKDGKKEEKKQVKQGFSADIEINEKGSHDKSDKSSDRLVVNQSPKKSVKINLSPDPVLRLDSNMQNTIKGALKKRFNSNIISDDKLSKRLPGGIAQNIGRLNTQKSGSSWFKESNRASSLKKMSMKTTPYEEKNEDRMEQFKLVMQDMQKATQKAESQVKKGLYAISGANMDEHAQVVRYLNKQPFTDDEIKEAFFTFDMNGNGSIGAAEIRFVLDALGEEVTEEEIDEMIRLLDADGDG